MMRDGEYAQLRPLRHHQTKGLREGAHAQECQVRLGPIVDHLRLIAEVVGDNLRNAAVADRPATRVRRVRRG